MDLLGLADFFGWLGFESETEQDVLETEILAIRDAISLLKPLSGADPLVLTVCKLSSSSTRHSV
jgi:hypothetical protein